MGVCAQMQNRAVENILAECMRIGLQAVEDYFPFQLTSK